MNSTINTVSISQARANLPALISQVVATLLPVTIIQRSQPTASIVDHNYLTSLEESVIDLTDALEAEHAKSDKTISLDSYIAKRWG